MPTTSLQERTQHGGIHREITIAFQPIVDTQLQIVISYEALVRGRNGESADSIFERIPVAELYGFDSFCRHTAVSVAARIGLQTRLSLNVLPNAFAADRAEIASLISRAQTLGISTSQLNVELTEWEQVTDVGRVRAGVRECRQNGLSVSIDDFGAGYSGLTLLAEVMPDAIKLDRGLIRGLHRCRQRRAIVAGVTKVCEQLGIAVVAEGVESVHEMQTLSDLNIHMAQGYLFARPAIERFPNVCWPHEELVSMC